MGLLFQNRLGLAAGMDKNGKHIDYFSSIGFGFVEVGTITPKPQKGNPKPRLFRIKKHRAIINRMGFNNEGMEEIYRNIRSAKRKDTILGVNIGKNKDTPNEKAHEDYLLCFRKLFDVADYFTVNVSSPNTKGLRMLQGKDYLQKIVETLEQENQKHSKPKPILIKLSPDATPETLDDIIAVVNPSSISGIIAGNTTIDKSSVAPLPEKFREGGLSGLPLGKKSTDMIRHIRPKLQPEKIIIGVGGIFSPEDALEKIEAGADLVQVYTGLVYRGPKIVKEINAIL